MVSIHLSDLSPTLFWDVDKTQIDFELHATHIVDKVMQRGTWEDFTKIIAYYGRERVGEIVKNLRFLDKQTLQFSSIYFQIPKQEMRCFIWQQSNPTHWNY